METSAWLLGCLIVAAAVGAAVWRARSVKAPSPPARARVAERSAPEPPSGSVPRLTIEEDDAEITLITASPLAELRAEFAAASPQDFSDVPRLEPFAAPERIEVERTPLNSKQILASLKGERSQVGITYEDDAEIEEATAPSARILLVATGDSDRGRLRARNEDSLLVMPERSLFAVADGMGGYEGGQIASAQSVAVLREAFETSTFSATVESEVPVPRRARELSCAMQMANEAIYAAAQRDPKLSKMGTTMVAARFSPNKQRVYIGHVGDSRCYRLRGDRLRQLTTDHTMGTLGVKGPRSGHLFQAVGIRPSITIDLIVDKPRDDDIYLLCSDGLSKMVSDDEVREVLLRESDVEAAVYALIEAANDRGGRDNITLVLIKVIARVGGPLLKGLAS